VFVRAWVYEYDLIAGYQEAVDLPFLLQELLMVHGQTCWDILWFKKNKMKMEQEMIANQM